MSDLPRITEPDEGLVHYQAPMITGNVTLCGLTDFIGHKKKGKPTRAKVTCLPCQGIVEFVRNAIPKPATPSQRLDAATVEREPNPFDDPKMFPGLRVIVPDWFVRNADRSNPKAAINYDAAYFGDECAALINGTRRALAAEPHQHGAGNGEPPHGDA